MKEIADAISPFVLKENELSRLRDEMNKHLDEELPENRRLLAYIKEIYSKYDILEEHQIDNFHRVVKERKKMAK